MTAPTQPPDPRVERIAKALAANKLSLITSVALARVLVEELGGRESVKHATAETDNRIDGWHKVCQALWSAYPNMDAAMQAAPVHDRPALAIHQLAESLNACRAQQRENAETIKTLKEQVEKAERNADVTDKNYEGLFRAAKKMEDDNKRLLAELDAIKGAQPSDTDIVQVMNRLMQKFRSLPMAYDSPMARAYVEAVRSLLSAPTLPVVGTYVKTSHYTLTWLADKSLNQQECERLALNEVAEYGGVAYRLYRDVTPLPTEGGK